MSRILVAIAIAALVSAGPVIDDAAAQNGDPTPTRTPPSAPTDTPTNTPTSTPTSTPTDAPPSTPTDTPTNTPTSTPPDTSTNTPTSTPTSIPTDTPTDTPTNTPTSTPTDTATNTPTSTPTNTPTPTATPTPIPVSACRTVGFWSTHAGYENGGRNLVDELLTDNCVVVCGERIDNTGVNNANSALEALCSPITGLPRVQLARQLTGAVLNCIASGGGNDCSLTTIAEEVAECDATCRTSNDKTKLSECIALISCLNSGGIFDEGFCQTGRCSDGSPCNESSVCGDSSACEPLEGSCTRKPLPLCDGKKCAVSSTKTCGRARASLCTIVPPHESSCMYGTKCPDLGALETCTAGSCPP